MSRTSSSSSDEIATVKAYNNVKFLCSYDGKILPRHTDGKLRYVGGITRVLSVDRSVSFADLLLKLKDLCGWAVCLRCQLPMEDLDALISITSDEDLMNLIEEYEKANQERSTPLKIKAFLSPVKPKSPPSLSAGKSVATVESSRVHAVPPERCVHQIYKPVRFPVRFEKSVEDPRYYSYHSHVNPRNMYLIPQGSKNNHWQ